MKLLDSFSRYKEEVPMSIMCIADLPKDSIDVDVYAVWEKWDKSAEMLIWISFLSLVYQNMIFIHYEVKKKSLFDKLMQRDRYAFTIKPNEQKEENDEMPWLESGILNVLKRGEHTLNEQIQLMVDHFLGMNALYINPHKELIVAVIKNYKEWHWSYSEMESSSKTLEITIFHKWIELSINEQTRRDFKKRITTFRWNIVNDSNNIPFKKFSSLLYTRIHKELASRFYRDDD